MRVRISWIVVALFFLSCCGAALAEATEHRIGGGVNYWVAVDDVDIDDVDDDGFSYLASYQYWPGLLGFEVDLEILPDRFGETALAPQAFVLLGRSIYGGAGVGIEYRDGDFADQPFFAFRGGLNLELLPGLYGDFYALYRFNDSADLDDENTDIDTDTLFFGAMVRLAL